MAPIRVGFIGLGAVSADAAAGAWAVVAHLPGLLAMPDLYQITAVCNSSVESAKRTIEYHKLPNNVKPYGSPEDIAADPNVDLVVVCVLIHKHFGLVEPALKARKMVYVEAPLGASLEEAKVLARLAREYGVRTMVGTQARASAAVNEARKIIQSGAIGEVIGSTFTGTFAGISVRQWPEHFKWGLDLEAPGNSLLIAFMHIFDTHRALLGELEKYNAHVESRNNTRDIVGQDGKVLDTVESTAPNYIFLQGKLTSGALASIAVRPDPIKSGVWYGADQDSEPSVRWIISGTEGELELTAPRTFWQVAGKLTKLYLTKGNERNKVDLGDDFDGIPHAAQNTAGQYKAFALGDTTKYADFDDAAKLAEIMEDLRNVGRRAL